MPRLWWLPHWWSLISSTFISGRIDLFIADYWRNFMMTDSDIANEASRLVSMAKRLAKHVSYKENLSFLEPVISKFTYFTSKSAVVPSKIGHNCYLTERDLVDGIKVCAAVEKTIDLPALFSNKTPLFRFKLHEFAFACAAFRMELTELLEKGLAAAKVKPPPQPEPIRGGRNEPPEYPDSTKPAEPTQQPEPTTVIVFVDQSSRLFEEEWVAAKAARQHALVASTAASIKDATNDLLIAIAQLGRAK